jgi:hypothetical protein
MGEHRAVLEDRDEPAAVGGGLASRRNGFAAHRLAAATPATTHDAHAACSPARAGARRRTRCADDAATTARNAAHVSSEPAVPAQSPAIRYGRAALRRAASAT